MKRNLKRRFSQVGKTARRFVRSGCGRNTRWLFFFFFSSCLTSLQMLALLLCVRCTARVLSALSVRVIDLTSGLVVVEFLRATAAAMVAARTEGSLFCVCTHGWLNKIVGLVHSLNHRDPRTAERPVIYRRSELIIVNIRWNCNISFHQFWCENFERANFTVFPMMSYRPSPARSITPSVDNHLKLHRRKQWTFFYIKKKSLIYIDRHFDTSFIYLFY